MICTDRAPAVAEGRLAVLTPRWGAPSETFVRQHVLAIRPGQTVALARRVVDPGWCAGIPLLSLRDIPETPIDRLARVLGSWQVDRRALALRDFLRDYSVDVVLGQWLNFSAKWAMTLSDLPVRFIAHAHGYDVTRRALSGPWNRILYGRLAHAEGVITFAEISRARLLAALPLRPERVHVIPYGVEVPAVPPARPERETITCLHVGRFVHKKAPLRTLTAFERALRQCPALRLEMIGDGPLFAACERFVAEKSLTGVVTLHGSKPHGFVKQRMAEADIFVLHCVTAPDGDEEGLPVAILEAMAHELPVVSTVHSGIPEAVLDGTTGLLVREHDDTTMARQLCALAFDSKARRAMGIAGRALADRRFSAEREIRELRRVLFQG